MPLLDRIERAVDAHPILLRRRRVRREAQMELAKITIDRNGFTASIGVRQGRQRLMTPAEAFGDTAEEAVEKLVASLDIIAEAFK